MLDRLLSLEPGVCATAERLITGFPGGFPQVLLLECIAQLGGILTVRKQDEGGFLASIDHARFSGQAREGDLLTVTARVLASFGRLVLVEGDVVCSGEPLLTARVALGIGQL